MTRQSQKTSPAAAATIKASTTEPARDCPACPRLKQFRDSIRAREPDWFNAPVPSFGPMDASLLIVGLAPGMQGANRTGRPFTGDYAGVLLYETLLKFGFAKGEYAARPDDGLALHDCRIANAVRCVPPENKPLPVEIATCRPYLIATLQAMPQLRAILMLGRIAHDSTLKTLAVKSADAPFKHGARHDVLIATRKLALFDSFHCSRYNTNTGRLTPGMFHGVFKDMRAFLDTPQ